SIYSLKPCSVIQSFKLTSATSSVFYDITGLIIFSHSLVNHAIVSILIMYLTVNWQNQHFQIAAVVTNVQEGFSDILVIILAHFSRTYRGSYNIIVTTNAAYIAGLAILWRSAEHMTADTAAKVYYGAVLLLTLGEAGRSAALNEFLDEQYSRERDQTEIIDDEKLQDRQEALWGLPWLLGAVVPLFLVKTTWEQIFMISTIVMAVFYLIFCCGYSFYFINYIEETMYPIEEAEREESGTDIKVNNLEQVQRQKICLDKEELPEPARGNIWSLKKKMEARHIVRQILAMWLTFLVYSVVTAAGSTFFFEQMSNLRIPIKNYDVAVYFNVISSFSKYAISYLWELMIPKKKKSRALTLVRIGCGLACTVLCCVAAWQVEIRRLKEIKKQGVGDTSEVIPMSIFWLVPQFSLLGIMEGLAVDGLIDFFVERVARPDDKVMVDYYASHTSDFVIGVGKLLTALSILAFRRRWFDDSINLSRLDKYYRALTFMSLIGFCYYLFVSTIYYTNNESQESTEDEENETNSHRTEKQESSPPLPPGPSPPSPQESSPPSPQEPSPALQQEPQDFLYHQQPPPPQHQPPPLPTQYYLPQYPPPPLQAYSPEQSYPPAWSFQPQPFRSRITHTHRNRACLQSRTHHSHTGRRRTTHTHSSRACLQSCTHHSLLTRFHIIHSCTSHNNADFLQQFVDLNLKSQGSDPQTSWDIFISSPVLLKFRM
ncbi:protein NRT1/ PTR FAMILY 5.10-like, partial [Rosa rugosa]|uniref:protein NRT1/ PTR FAMILY 5.10-like n=1 Tax=Rosa rugosa TaxID=74645 RepID=UPI002B40A522